VSSAGRMQACQAGCLRRAAHADTLTLIYELQLLENLKQWYQVVSMDQMQMDVDHLIADGSAGREGVIRSNLMAHDMSIFQ
jgi:hypothetical protein